jgi:colicin import membrane protein
VLRTTPDVDGAKDRLVDTWETTRVAVAPRLVAAREAMSPYVDEARSRLTPAVERLSPAVDDARQTLRTKVVPAVVAAAETARDNSAPARAEAKQRAGDAILVLRGAKPAKRRRWPLALACLIGGAALGAYAGMRKSAAESTGYTPAPFPAAQPPADPSPAAENPAATSATGVSKPAKPSR